MLGQCPTQEAGERESQVSGELSLMRTKLKDLKGSLSRVEERLVPIVRQEPPRVCGTAKEPPPMTLVPLAEALRGLHLEVESMITNTDSLFHRLEL
jgi:hypothetical protein